MNPQFRITNIIARGLTRIERACGFLDAAKLSEEWITVMQQRALVLEYFTIGLSSQIAEVQAKGESLIRLDGLTSKHKLTARQRAALELAANMPVFRMENFEDKCPGVHRRSLQRDLRALIEKHLIVAEGATNRLIYRISGNP